MTMMDDPGDFDIGPPERRWEVFPLDEPLETPAPELPEPVREPKKEPA